MILSIKGLNMFTTKTKLSLDVGRPQFESEEQMNAAADRLAWRITGVYAVLNFMVSIVADEAVEAVGETMKDKSLCRMKVKQDTRKLLAAAQAYNRGVGAMFRDSDARDKVDDHIEIIRGNLKREEVMMRMAISNYFLKIKHPHAGALSRAVLSMAIADTALNLCEKEQSHLNKHGAHLHPYRWFEQMAGRIKSAANLYAESIDKALGFTIPPDVEPTHFRAAIEAWSKRVLYDTKAYQLN